MSLLLTTNHEIEKLYNKYIDVFCFVERWAVNMLGGGRVWNSAILNASYLHGLPTLLPH